MTTVLVECGIANGFPISLAQNFDIFDGFQPDRQNLTRQIVYKQYSVYRCMVKD